MRQTKRRQKPRQKLRNPTTAAQTAPWADDDDPLPENIDDFRNALARRIAMFIGNRTGAWRDCPVPACRRARQCRPRQIRCRNAPQRPPSMPENTARVMAQLQRLLRERVERDESRSNEAGQ